MATATKPTGRKLSLPPRETARGKPIRWRIREVHGDDPGPLLPRVYDDVEDAREDAAERQGWVDMDGKPVRFVVETD